MTDMQPSLKSLLAFEATIRLGSMSAAGRELGATQPAISQRIRHLEDVLGVALFERSGQRLRPTADGHTYHEEIAPALERITAATRRAHSRARSRVQALVLAVHFGFAHLWLLPRLARLEGAFPGTGFEILPVDRDDSREAMAADIGIRFGLIEQVGEDEWPLLPEAVYPVCSPGFAHRHGLSPDVPPAVDEVPLLHMDSRDPRWLDWAQWCRRAGLKEPGGPPRFHYNNYPLLLHAAIEGRGLALGWHGLVDTAIAEGTLVALAPVVRRPSRGYILRTAYGDRALLKAVVDWFRRELPTDGP